ncbi:MAG: ribonuclease P/MRP protein subunit RPP1 [Candidatus Nanohaloarchaea archaeon]|jgi:ribonuclease P/MRP protein subunit RPP1
MPEFYDLCIRNKSDKVVEKMQKLGWTVDSELETVFLEADDWGELKRKIGENREKADVLVFRGGDEKLNRKAVEDPRIDILLHPEKGRKTSGFNHVLAKEASKNSVALGLDFKMLDTSNKTRSHIFRHWQRNLMLCEKYDAPYVITSSAEAKYDLRAPRDLASIIDSLGSNGKKAVSDHPEKIRGEE